MTTPLGRKRRKARALQKLRDYMHAHGQNCAASDQAWKDSGRAKPKPRTLRYWTTRAGLRWKGGEELDGGDHEGD